MLTNVTLAMIVIMMQLATTQRDHTIARATTGTKDQAITVQVCLWYLSLNE